MWRLWYERNKLVMDNQSPNSLNVVVGAKNTSFSYQEANFEPSSLSSPNVNPCWMAPTLGALKVNFDAAISKVQSGAELTAVIRENQGQCLRWQSKFVKHIIESTYTEALAARIAIEMALDFPRRTIEVEDDCLVIVNDINKRDWNHSLFGPIIKDICIVNHRGFMWE
ncbi:UNVERIFIED_CONTAM: hypothetical protein Scaly_2737700 [Sesamum calycinum]|uniref:RNase H type-1 domain-containing protein n=1 Tax=Sesamum calycinum TaxID=2727403 RepID=A0AAW2J3M7_9LAMI